MPWRERAPWSWREGVLPRRVGLGRVEHLLGAPLERLLEEYRRLPVLLLLGLLHLLAWAAWLGLLMRSWILDLITPVR